MGSMCRVSGELHRNDWFHDWLVENEIEDESAAYKAAKNPRLLSDLTSRAQAQQTEPISPPSGRSIVAGRSLDLTNYLACGHADCLTRQVDDLFSRVWHYFDKIAISGPDAHVFLDSMRGEEPESIAQEVAQLARPIFHIRDIGADELVTWVSKPPACQVHWKEYEKLKDYHLPKRLVAAMASQLREEGVIRLEKRGSKSYLVLFHRDLFSGRSGRSLEHLSKWKKKGETPEDTLVRQVVEEHWAGAASDIYTATSMALPLGLGVSLEARMADIRRDSLSPSEVAFNLVLPVVDGLPVKELIALRESENDAFEGFRDSLTQAIKERLKDIDTEACDAGGLAEELQSDIINPALHRIQRRLKAAEGVLQRNHRYNIAIAGLATICGIFTSPDIATAVAAVALTGVGLVESQFTSEKRDIALEDMYFLWKAKEYAQNKNKSPRQIKRSRKR